MMDPANRRSFATTRWSLIAAASDQDSPDSRAALGELCQQYWVPLYAFALRRGFATEDAQDVTQAFFADLLDDDLLSKADASRGRFRGYLLTAFDRFTKSQWRREYAQKRGGHLRKLSLDFGSIDQSRYTESSENPELAFRREWALTLLYRVVARLREEYVDSGQAKLFDQLEHQWNPSAERTPHAEIAKALGIKAAAVDSAAHRIRHRYRAVLRDLVADTVASEDQIEDEIRDLMNSFSEPS
ncbi:MAG: hypothetical protein AAGA03_18775 [Planctomycetota bacterium]